MIAIGLGLTLAWGVHKVGWSRPPSLLAQFADVATQTPACAEHHVYPAPKSVGVDDEARAQFVALSLQCPGSDQLSFYALSD